MLAVKFGAHTWIIHFNLLVHGEYTCFMVSLPHAQFITLIYTNKIIAFNFVNSCCAFLSKKKIHLNIIKYKEIIKYYLYKSNNLI